MPWECPPKCLSLLSLQPPAEIWPRIPERTRKHALFPETWKKIFRLPVRGVAALELIAADPNLGPAWLAAWRHSGNRAKMDTVHALLTLRDMPWGVEQLPEAAQTHPFILQTAVEGSISLLEKDDSFTVLLCPKLLETSAMQAFFQRREQARKLAEQERTARLQKETEAGRKRSIHEWLKKIRRHGEAYAAMPASFQGEPVLLSALRKRIGPSLQRNWHIWECLPSIIRQDPCLQNVYRIAKRRAETGE
jgi:hypothetical protein